MKAVASANFYHECEQAVFRSGNIAEAKCAHMLFAMARERFGGEPRQLPTQPSSPGSVRRCCWWASASAMRISRRHSRPAAVCTPRRAAGVGRQPGGGSIKPFVIGRKNFFFANTPLGVQACAVIYSLIETVKELGPDPFLYLTGVLDTAPALDRTVEGCAAAPG